MSCTMSHLTQNMRGCTGKNENILLYVAVIIEIVKTINKTFVLFIATCFDPKWSSAS
jgi:hypothetical protein